MKNEGGNVGAALFFGLGIVAFIAAAVLYLIKDDSTSKQWAEQTRGVVKLNENLVEENKKLVGILTDLTEAQDALEKSVTEQKSKVEKIEFAILMPPKQIVLPHTVNFRMIKAAPTAAVEPPKPPATTGSVQLSDKSRKALVKKVKKQVRELSQ